MLPTYDPRTDYSHWDSGLWTRVLAASGVRNPFTGAPFTEAMLAGLAGGIGFMLFIFEYKETTTASAVTRFHPGPYTENLLHRSGAPVNIQQTGSATLAQSRLDAALDTAVPAVVRVVRGKLPWVGEDSPAETDSMDIAVVGRDGEDYVVDDGGGQLERIAPDTLAHARGSRKADKHWQAHVVQGSGSALTAEALRQAMAETAQALLSDQAPPGVPPGYARNFGIAGLHDWAQRLTDTQTKRGWARIFADPERSLAGLGMLHGLLAGKRYSGPGGLRPLYAQFLQEVAQDHVPGIDASALAQAAAHYQDLGARWDRLTELVGAAEGANFATMALQVEAIASLETTAATFLKAATSGTD